MNSWPMASYRVEVTNDARTEIRRLPGNIRQRVIRTLRTFGEVSRPSGSRVLDVARAGIDLTTGSELRRVRLESWRVVYPVEDEAQLVTILAVRKRPPYQYDDLGGLVADR